MNAIVPKDDTNTKRYKNILVALDTSDYAKVVLAKAVAVASATVGTQITGIHVTTTANDGHANQIMDEARQVCLKAKIPFNQRVPQGREYRLLLEESLAGNYDLLVIGYKGTGGPREEKMGGVCELVVNRAAIDTLVVGDSGSQHRQGPILVLVDGSEEAMEGIQASMELGRYWRRRVILATVYDADYHSILFDTIRKIDAQTGMKLSQSERWKTLSQDWLGFGWHTVYQDLLRVVSKTLTNQTGVRVSYELLTGKPDIAVRKFMLDSEPALLVMGRNGIHQVDASLTMGSLTHKLFKTETCFTFMTTCDLLILCQPKTEMAAGGRTDHSSRSSPEEENVNRKILIADDEYFHRELMLQTLAPYGDCDTAENGMEALELYENALASGRAYDLITLDIEMPLMDGHKALRAIRAKEKEWDLPMGGRTAVVMVTSLDSPSHVDTAHQDGCTNYFTKPVDGEKLLASIQKRLSLGKNVRPRNNKPRRIPKLDSFIAESIKPFFTKWSEQTVRMSPIVNEKRRSGTELSLILDAAIKRAIQLHWNKNITDDHFAERKPAPTDPQYILLRGIYANTSHGFALTVQFESDNGALLDTVEIKIRKSIIPITINT